MLVAPESLPYIRGTNFIAMSWESPNTIVGPAAEDKKYLDRPSIIEEFWQAIDRGEHILFTAPRRVGKSSVMKELQARQRTDTLVIYQDVESDSKTQEFYKRLWGIIVERLDGKGKAHEHFIQWWKSRSIAEVGAEGVTIERSEIDHKEELLTLIKKLGEERIRVVLLLDEFPDVVAAIQREEGKDAAKNLLNTMRSIRQDGHLKNFKFVLAGSVGLGHVVASVDRPRLINDLRTIHIPALTEPEAHALLDLLLSGATMQLDNACRAALLAAIHHKLPVYIQLMIEELDTMARKRNDPTITQAMIPMAMENVIQENKHFVDWESRLRSYLDPKDYAYSESILTRCAHQESFTLQEAYNLSKSLVPVAGYRALIDDVLVKDGYLYEDRGTLSFLSPFLKKWWGKRHPEYEIE